MTSHLLRPEFPPFRLACADFTFPLLPHDNVLDLIVALEISGVDIGLLEGRSHLQPSNQFDRLPESARITSAKLSDRGLSAADVFLIMGSDFAASAINHPQLEQRRRARDTFLKTLEYAKYVESPHVTTLPGVFFDDEDKSISWQRSQDELAWRVEASEAYGIIFSIEAHLGSLMPSPADAERMIAAVPGLSLTLDYAHFTYTGVPDAEIEPLLAYASHMHVRGACPGRMQVPLKHNTIDYHRALRGLRSQEYQGYIGLEYVWSEWERCNETDNLSETILFRDFLLSVNSP